MNKLLRRVGYRLARYLSETNEEEQTVASCSRQELINTLEPGDVLLVDGASRFSMAIKYITQSTWSHAALYVGEAGKLKLPDFANDELVLIEADVTEGVRAVSLDRYCNIHSRICRPVGLDDGEVQQIIDFMSQRIGDQYDLDNIIDLARYLIQTPPVPKKYRRRLLALGSGDPTKAICSSLIARSFQSVNYPILPVLDEKEVSSEGGQNTREEILHIRHHSLFAPRDFDVSPYFQIVKPTVQEGFDPHKLKEAEEEVPPVSGARENQGS